jgi:hypothetical protein
LCIWFLTAIIEKQHQTTSDDAAAPSGFLVESKPTPGFGKKATFAKMI